MDIRKSKKTAIGLSLFWLITYITVDIGMYLFRHYSDTVAQISFGGVNPITWAVALFLHLPLLFAIHHLATIAQMKTLRILVRILQIHFSLWLSMGATIAIYSFLKK